MIGFRKAFQITLGFALTAALWAAVPPRRAAAGTTILVNTTDNTLGDGLCSLQEAVQAANTDTPKDSEACPGGSGTDTITFNIGASGSTQTITLSTALQISAPVFIDGTTQPGYNYIARVPLIEITGSSLQLITLAVGSDGSTIGGLRLTSTYGSAFGYLLTLQSGGNFVVGNYIGTDGTQVANSYALGVWIFSSNNTIGGTTPADRNLFGGGQGVYIAGGSGNTIEGNYFGVGPDGVTALTGMVLRGDGVGLFTESSTSNTIRGNVINGYIRGVLLRSSASLNTVVGNLIGLGADGTTVLGNSQGVFLWGGASNVIGGTSAADRNVISGNTDANIRIQNDGSNTAKDNVIQGNYIGTTEDGLSAALPGTGYGTGTGIRLQSGATNTIGGTAAGSGNVISGNATGIYIEALVPGTIIRGNFIGTNAGGTAAVPSGSGIVAYSDVNIGDAGTPGNNVISGNTHWYGILIQTASTATIYGNRIGLTADGTGAIPNQVGMDIYGTATVAENWIAHSTNQGLNVEISGNINSGSSDNCFTSNGSFGASNSNTAVPQPLTNNWWGSHTGPTQSGNPGGTGDDVSDYVLYSPFMTYRAAACSLPGAHLFADVPDPGKEWMEPWIDAFYYAGITTGCGGAPLIYCPENRVTRAEMAVFLLRAKHGAGYAPPAASDYFDDVPVTSKEWMMPWIDEYYREGLTTGCGHDPLIFCPENNVTRAEMAVFVLRALHGGGYSPPAATHTFADVPVTGKEWMEPWIDQFAAEGITTGCGGGNYCPENNVTRAEMAVFIGRAYGLYP